MAFPFGGHPTLGAYMLWAHKTHGFHCQTGVSQDGMGKSHSFVKISKDDGPSVVVVGMNQSEHLVASMVGFLNRRLGVVAPWFSVDAPEIDP
jgi:hypothetical protein